MIQLICQVERLQLVKLENGEALIGKETYSNSLVFVIRDIGATIPDNPKNAAISEDASTLLIAKNLSVSVRDFEHHVRRDVPADRHTLGLHVLTEWFSELQCEFMTLKPINVPKLHLRFVTKMCSEIIVA